MDPSEKVFGQSLDVAIKSQQARGIKSDIPNVITEITSWLENQHGMLE